jgi:uncharacterized protein (DUF2164 family)
MTPIKIAREEKNLLIAQVQQYAEEQFGEPIGNIAAEGLLDEILTLVTPFVYNQAIADTKKVLADEWTRLDEELNVLERPITRRR